MIADSPGYVSNNVPANLTKGTSTICHAIVFGNWPGPGGGGLRRHRLRGEPLRAEKARRSRSHRAVLLTWVYGMRRRSPRARTHCR